MLRTIFAPLLLLTAFAAPGCDEPSDAPRADAPDGALPVAAAKPAEPSTAAAPVPAPDAQSAGNAPAGPAPTPTPAPAQDPHAGHNHPPGQHPPEDPHAGHAHGPLPTTPQVSGPTSGPQPEIYADEPTVDLGEVLQGETRGHAFVVGNRGQADLVIRRVSPSCGCTVAQVTGPDGTVYDAKQPVTNQDLLSLKPGETCAINLEFNSTGQPPQHHEKVTTVISSDNRNPALRLSLKVEVTRPVMVEPNPLTFGDVTRGATRTERVWAKLVKIEDLEITGIQNKPEFLDVKWQKATAPDGTPAIALDITILPSAPIGYLSTAVMAETNNERVKTVPITIYANIKSEVVFDTGNKVNQERVDFEVINAGEVHQRTIEVTNQNPAIPYHISGLEVDSKFADQIKAELVEHEHGVRYTITLTTDPSLTARFFRGILKIKSEHGDLAEKQIQFHGWTKKAE